MKTRIKINKAKFKGRCPKQNMINKIDKERRHSMNAAPTRPSNKRQRQGAQEDPKEKQDRAQGRVRAGKPQATTAMHPEGTNQFHECC
jgi:hypothetical protein